MTQKTMFKDSEKRLRAALEESSGTYTISKDGYVSVNMTHPKVRESFRLQAEQMRKLIEEGKLVLGKKQAS